ncbi:MAG TPA: efflux RND transporter periplasmic adaptor subunit, partial [Terracidiphilus sp.]
NRITRRAVVLGLQGSLLAEVRSGVQQNDRVVLGNAARYRDGEQVTPRVEPRPANDVMHEEGGMIDPQAEQGGN